MELTFIAAIQVMIGLAIVIAGSLRSAFVFLLVSGMFGGSAAILLPALGGSSIPPIQLALAFVYLRILAPRGGFVGRVPEALQQNLWLLVFVAYGVAIAFLGPRMFAGLMNVAPMRPTSFDMFEALPLVPTSQNITSAFYLVGTLLVAVAAYIVCRYCRGGYDSIISAGIAIGWAHIALGVLVVAASGTPAEAFFELFRNGSYAQLNQAHDGFIRIRGVFPEPSGYAEFGFAFFVLNAELWYRSIRTGATGAVALTLAAVLCFSTSSTAYVGLFGYGLFFMLRALLLPQVTEWTRVRQFLVAGFGIAVIAALVILAKPELATRFFSMVAEMTVEKSGSTSGRQRLFWALQGWDAFKVSYGLGIGPGSFRSSSYLTAIIGSMGLIGVFSFVAYIMRVLQPWRRSTFGRGDVIEQTVGGAFAMAAVLSLIPAAVSSPKPDPGTTFAFMAGAAIALRPRHRKHGAAEQDQHDHGEPRLARQEALALTSEG